ncbi:MAG: hypothetical protein ACJAT1_002189 [Marivirga sp.]|jgi:hypothetical protein
MKTVIEKFYNALFLGEEKADEVPYANKKFMFWFSVISFSVVLFFIIKDILQNIAQVKA